MTDIDTTTVHPSDSDTDGLWACDIYGKTRLVRIGDWTEEGDSIHAIFDLPFGHPEAPTAHRVEGYLFSSFDKLRRPTDEDLFAVQAQYDRYFHVAQDQLEQAQIEVNQAGRKWEGFAQLMEAAELPLTD